MKVDLRRDAMAIDVKSKWARGRFLDEELGLRAENAGDGAEKVRGRSEE